MTHRLAILTDIHGDLQALEDALASIERLGCDTIVCAGDVVDFGLFPDETIALLAARRIPTIRGNHDRWALDSTQGLGGGWELADDSRAFLAKLPRSWSATIEGVRVAVHHASPKGDMDGLLPDEVDHARGRGCLERADADVLLVGHTHVACALEIGGYGLILNPGALLRDPVPAGENPPATGTFGVIELPTRMFTVRQARDGAVVESVVRRLI